MLVRRKMREVMVIPALSPRNSVLVDAREEEMVQNLYVGFIRAIEGVIGLKVEEEEFPFVDEAGDNVHPHAFNASIVYARAPDVRATVQAAYDLLKLSDKQVLDTVIASNATRKSPLTRNVDEEPKDGHSAIIVTHADAHDTTGVSINERVGDKFPMNKTCYC